MSSTEYTTISPTNLQLVNDALGDYAHRMGIDFAKNPFAEELQRINTLNDILNLLQQREEAFIQYRNRNRTLINCFSPAVRVLHIFSEKLGDVVSLVSFEFRDSLSHFVSMRSFQLDFTSPSLLQRLSSLESMFSSLCVYSTLFSTGAPCDAWVCQAASNVSSDYDALLDLFECLGNFLKRLDVYINIPPTKMMTDIIVKIMVELLSVLAFATKQIKRGRFSTCSIKSQFGRSQRAAGTFAKKLLGDGEIGAVLRRLDRLTQDEARTTGAQTLSVVHGLVSNMKVVMGGTQAFLDLSLTYC
jgi:hypothetical protein